MRNQTGGSNNFLIDQENKVPKARALRIAQPVSVENFASVPFDGGQIGHVRFRCIAHRDPIAVFRNHTFAFQLTAELASTVPMRAERLAGVEW